MKIFLKTIDKLIQYTDVAIEVFKQFNIFKKAFIKILCWIFGIDFETHCYKKTGCLANQKEVKKDG